MNWRPMRTAPKDGTQVLLLIEDIAIQGHWALVWKKWVTVILPSHGCGCCASDDEEPEAWMPLPDLIVTEKQLCESET